MVFMFKEDQHLPIKIFFQVVFALVLLIYSTYYVVIQTIYWAVQRNINEDYINPLEECVEEDGHQHLE